MKPVIVTHDQWKKIKKQIKQDYPPSVLLVRSKMRSVLGFTNRSHYEWNENDLYMDRYVHLDFFDEAKRTYFLLKYGDLIT